MHEIVYKAGDRSIGRQYTCTRCGLKLNVRQHHPLPICPRCHNHEYTLDVIFYDNSFYF